MDVEREKWLTERLQEGIEVKELFPHEFSKGSVYYDISIHGKRIGVVVEVERKNLNHINAEPLRMQISKVFQIVRGDPKEVECSNLINHYVTFVPETLKFKKTDHNPLLLNGKIFLQ